MAEITIRPEDCFDHTGAPKFAVEPVRLHDWSGPGLRVQFAGLSLDFEREEDAVEVAKAILRRRRMGPVPPVVCVVPHQPGSP